MVFHGKSTINYFLRVIPTLNHYSDIVSDIPFGSVYMSYLFWHSIWQYLTFFLAYTLTFYLASILTYFLAYILTFFLTVYLASILTFYLVSFQAFFLAYVLTSSLTFFLAYESGISSDILSGILFGISLEVLCGWGPAGTTAIKSLLFGSGEDRCDQELAVEVRRGSLWSRGCCSGPAEEQEAGGGRRAGQLT